MKSAPVTPKNAARLSNGSNIFRVFSLLLWAMIFSVSCSVPNLENQQCIEARETVKQFYSLHFGHDMKPGAYDRKELEPFLTERLNKELTAQGQTAQDYFTQTENYPKAFRVGACEAVSETESVLEVLLFWKDETSADQREISVETVKIGEKWLIDRVAGKP